MKNRGRLAVQLGAIVTAVFLAVLVVVGFIVVHGTKQMYVESHNEWIIQDLDDYKDLFLNPEIADWVLDGWQQDPGMMQEPETEAEQDMLYYLQEANDAGRQITMENVGEMSPEVQKAFRKAAYRFLVQWADRHREEKRCDSVFVLDVRTDDDLYKYDKDDVFVILESSEDTEGTGYNSLGVYWSRKVGITSLQKMQTGTYGVDYGDYLFQDLSVSGYDVMYLAMTPVFIGDELRYVFCLEYDWPTFGDVLNEHLQPMIIFSLLGLVLANVLLVLFIYRKAVKPLVQVNEGVREYMETKDGEAAARDMAKVKTRNEVGVLATSIGEMAVEIERYTKENLELNSERQRVATELNLAAKIQEDSLPTEFAVTPEAELFASMDPAKEVGGDFYDFFMIDETHLGLVIADVSGKGVPAALFMMVSKNLLKNFAMTGLAPAKVLEMTNTSLCENNKNNMFVTVWFGILDLASGRVTAANGGHEYPMLRKADGAFEMLKDKHGVVLGVMKDMPYKQYEFDIEPGGTLFVYTDGAPEATNAKEELFGTERMLEALNRRPEDTPEVLTDSLKKAINDFVGEAPQFDDLTTLCVRYTPGAAKQEQDAGAAEGK